MPDPKEMPKSIASKPPSDLSSKKFSRCLSPIPKIYPQIQTAAREVIKCFLMYTKLSGVVLSPSNACLTKSQGTKPSCILKFFMISSALAPRATICWSTSLLPCMCELKLLSQLILFLFASVSFISLIL